MSRLTTYIVAASWFNDATVKLQVDLDLLTPEVATEINQFFLSDEQYADEDGEAVLTAIRLFGSAAIRYFMADGGIEFSSESGDAHYTQQVLDDQREGWPGLAELGILIVSAEVSAVWFDDVTVVPV